MLASVSRVTSDLSIPRGTKVQTLKEVPVDSGLIMNEYLSPGDMVTKHGPCVKETYNYGSRVQGAEP